MRLTSSRGIDVAVRTGAIARVVLTAAAALLFAGAGPVAAAPAPSLAIFASAGLPIEGLSWFDQAAVEPALVSDAELAQLERAGVRPIAIIDAQRASAVVATPGGVTALLGGLAHRHFAGYLIDARSGPSAAASAKSLLAEATQRFPAAAIYFRGPADQLPPLPMKLTGYIADGIFTTTAEAARDEKAPAPIWRDEPGSAGRLAALIELHRRRPVPIVVVEAVPVGQRDRARSIARKLADQGFMPYVTVGGAGLGIGQREAIPRRILALYDSDDEPYDAVTFLHRIATVPFEYAGYILEYVDLRKSPLPAGDLASRYAGIVTRFNNDELPAPGTYQRWLERQIDSGLRVVMFGRTGFAPTNSLLRRMGLVESQRKLRGPMLISKTSKMIGFEAYATPLLGDLRNWRAVSGDVHLALRDAGGQTVTPVVTGAWGGLALDPYLVDQPVGTEKQRWIIDPFAFIARALDLRPMPVPDTTTENGRRLLFVHIDGDAFASIAEMPGRRYSGQVIARDFLQRYPFPTTVSVIESDTSPTGNYPALSSQLEAIAKSIFRLPNIEPASHSFSHPFDWLRAAQGLQGRASDKKDPVHLPIPGYHYSAAREIGGSLRYISTRLAPPDRPARVFLWSGDARPQADAMAEIVAGNLLNMNGGAGEIPSDNPTLSMVTSLGREVDGMLQVYAQAQNDNVYTNEWRGPFYGFRRVVDMFRYTEQPRRLKPINIYYHFYSGTKAASVAALREVYEYAAAQETMAVYVSEMCPKIQDYFRARIARRLDGGWELRGFGSLRTVRVDNQLGWPDLEGSSGVIGVHPATSDSPQGARYVALSGAPSATLLLQPDPPGAPHLVAANAAVVAWSREGRTLRFALRGHLPVTMTVGACTPQGDVAGARARVDAATQTVALAFSRPDTGPVTLRCK